MSGSATILSIGLSNGSRFRSFPFRSPLRLRPAQGCRRGGSLDLEPYLAVVSFQSGAYLEGLHPIYHQRWLQHQRCLKQSESACAAAVGVCQLQSLPVWPANHIGSGATGSSREVCCFRRDLANENVLLRYFRKSLSEKDVRRCSWDHAHFHIRANTVDVTCPDVWPCQGWSRTVCTEGRNAQWHLAWREAQWISHPVDFERNRCSFSETSTAEIGNSHQ